jgi:hypothetical protein
MQAYLIKKKKEIKMTVFGVQYIFIQQTDDTESLIQLKMGKSDS